jgi:hypothetical protein
MHVAAHQSNSWAILFDKNIIEQLASSGGFAYLNFV